MAGSASHLPAGFGVMTDRAQHDTIVVPGAAAAQTLMLPGMDSTRGRLISDVMTIVATGVSSA